MRRMMSSSAATLPNAVKQRSPIPGLVLITAGAALTASIATYMSRQVEDRKEHQLERLKGVINRYSLDGAEEAILDTSRLAMAIRPDEMPMTTTCEEDAFCSRLHEIISESVSYPDLVFFELLLNHSEARYKHLFVLFSDDGARTITRQKLAAAIRGNDKLIMSLTTPFWVSLFGGTSPDDSIEVEYLLQLRRKMRHLIDEQRFLMQSDDGVSVSPEQFPLVFSRAFEANSIPGFVRQNLTTLGAAFNKERLNFETLVPVYDLLEFYHEVSRDLKVLATAQRSMISKADLCEVIERSTGGQIVLPPLVVDILFHIFNDPTKPGVVNVGAFLKVLSDQRTYRFSTTKRVHARSISMENRSAGVLEKAVKVSRSFALGGVAGAIGATAVYPIDTVKSRMQAQRAGAPPTTLPKGTVYYTSSINCFQQTFQREGFRGFYRGLGPQLIGVAPEKAVKLVVNDLMRSAFSSNDDEFGDKGGNNDISLSLEILSGGTAGASQVLVTNPLEITKIRLQLQGASGGARLSAMEIVSDLGLAGLYKGSSACFMRDIPFSAIYFPLYASLKKGFAQNGENQPYQLFVAGTLAGVAAAGSTTPFDVIKTRLQMIPREGEAPYRGLAHCASQIMKTEGPLAFFKGVLPRVLRSAPQFGVTLFCYELLQQFAAKHLKGGSIDLPAPTNAPVARFDEVRTL